MIHTQIHIACSANQDCSTSIWLQFIECMTNTVHKVAGINLINDKTANLKKDSNEEGEVDTRL